MSQLIPIEREGVRVLLTSQLAEAYETTPEIISNNFNRNKTRYTESKHYFLLEGEALKEFKATVHQIDDQFKHTPKVYLWTEKGALLHAKSLNTDKAWEVYDHLVETYFRMQQVAADSSQLQVLMNLKLEQQRQAAALQAIEQKLDRMQTLPPAPDLWNWREDCERMVERIAQVRNVSCQIVQWECFCLVDFRCHVRLAVRLRHEQIRIMRQRNLSDPLLSEITELDIIADDIRLIKGYVEIVHEMAVKYGAA